MSGKIVYFLFAVFGLTYTANLGKEKRCDGFRANFSMNTIMGTWYVVAIIPKNVLSEYEEEVVCYKVDFSETDVAGLKWLANRTLNHPHKEVLDRINGTIVRQRYHIDPPYDVWSKSVEGVSGCFQEVFSLDMNSTNRSKEFDAMMQIHLFEKSNEPFLLQMLWGKVISVVVYSRRENVDTTQLKDISDVVTDLRGPQQKPRICGRSVKDLMQSKP
ncbi:uncharacterized protein LOC126380589 [Pectinophora gossypiella]|uniref:uncharacterized protein LOC126380589 n=1 Tax=Pectinophora gossypiella TaxID=13191 RepID=UPI00214E04F3|nr:uncharacterized protein LOC126380589 [Pectinophora gossypiella]